MRFCRCKNTDNRGGRGVEVVSLKVVSRKSERRRPESSMSYIAS